MPKKENILLCLNTGDRISSTTNAGSAEYNLPNAPLMQRQSEATFNLLSAEIPNVMYPISAARRNNTLYFYEDGSTATTFTATLADNAYSGSQIASALGIAMNASAAANTYTVTYDSQSKKLSFATDGTSLKITTGTLSIEDEIGANVSDGFDDPYVPAGPVSLNGTKYIDMEIRNFVTHNVCSGNSHLPMYRIQMAAEFGEIMFHRSLQEEHIRANMMDLRRLHVNLYDDKGILIDVPHNHDLSFVIKIGYDHE